MGSSWAMAQDPAARKAAGAVSQRVAVAQQRPKNPRPTTSFCEVSERSELDRPKAGRTAPRPRAKHHAAGRGGTRAVDRSPKRQITDA